jgi:hypothetical protein
MHLSRIAGLVVISSVLVAASWDTTDTSAEVAPTAAAAPADADAGAPIAVANVTGGAPVAGGAPSPRSTVEGTPVAADAGRRWLFDARRAPPGRSRMRGMLVLVGDSLHEASGLVAFLTAPKQFVPKFWGGTAPCDWVDNDLQATRSTVVVISFTGNSLTPCMADGAGGFLEHEAFAEEYRGDLEVLITRARRAGARVVLVGQPTRSLVRHEDRVAAINGMLQEFATRWAFVSYVDAGAAVEAPDGQFADRLPCTQFDIDCAADGQTVVRGDGVHFCPVVNVTPCPVYSSGALRFALAIANAANDPAAFD